MSCGIRSAQPKPDQAEEKNDKRRFVRSIRPYRYALISTSAFRKGEEMFCFAFDPSIGLGVIGWWAVITGGAVIGRGIIGARGCRCRAGGDTDGRTSRDAGGDPASII